MSEMKKASFLQDVVMTMKPGQALFIDTSLYIAIDEYSLFQIEEGSVTSRVAVLNKHKDNASRFSWSHSLEHHFMDKLSRDEKFCLSIVSGMLETVVNHLEGMNPEDDDLRANDEDLIDSLREAVQDLSGLYIAAEKS